MTSPTPPRLRIQPLTRARLSQLGSVGDAWTDDLADRLGRLARRWGLRLGGALPGGSASYVCRAETGTGSQVVIKVGLPGEPLARQAAVLRRADGRGYVRLLEEDHQENAVLLEKLGASLAASGQPVEAQLATMVDVLGAAWQQPEAAPPTEPRQVKAAGLATLIARCREQWPSACPEPVIETALGHADWLAAHPVDDPVLVHGDPHPLNTLRVDRSRPGAEHGYVFVDPDGFVEDRGYDLGVAMRDFSALLLAADRPRTLVDRWAELLGARAGVDAGRVRAWSFLERVSTGCYLLSFGAERVARPFLDSAARLVGAPGSGEGER